MSGQSQNWPIPTDALGVFKAQEKRLTQEERRPRITKASDLMGPALGPYAVTITDLNSDAAAFNGMWFAPVGAIQSPDGAVAWMGYTTATPDGGGTQVAWTFASDDAPHLGMMRGFEYAITGGTRFYSDWQPIAPEPEVPVEPLLPKAGLKTMSLVANTWSTVGVTFDDAFPSGVGVSVTATPSSTSTVALLECRISGESHNGFTLRAVSGTTTARSFNWIAYPYTE